MKKIKVTKRILKNYVNKLISESNFQSPMVTPTTNTPLSGFTYVAGGTITGRFVPALKDSIEGGGTGFGNVGEVIFKDIDRFFPGAYKLNAINSRITIGSGIQQITIGGANFVNSDLCFTRTDGKLYEYDASTGTVKIDIALVSAKLSYSAARGGGPLANPFTFEKFNKVIYEVIASVMQSPWYRKNITDKAILPKMFSLKAGGLCGNFYPFPQSDGFTTTSIPNDHNKKLRYVFYTLDPGQNYNVHVLPNGAVANTVLAQRPRSKSGRSRGADATDFSHQNYKDLRNAVYNYITTSWNAHIIAGNTAASNPGSGTVQSQFLDASNNVKYFDEILGGPGTPGYQPGLGSFPPLTRVSTLARTATNRTASAGASAILFRTTRGATPPPRFSLVGTHGNPKTNADLNDFLQVLGLSNPNDIYEFPQEVKTKYPQHAIDIRNGSPKNLFGVKMMIFYKAVLGCFSPTVTVKSKELERLERDIIYKTTTSVGFTAPQLTPSINTKTNAVSFSSFQIVNSANTTYPNGKFRTVASAANAYYSCDVKEHKIEVEHSSVGIRDKIVEHIQINHPGYQYSDPVRGSKRFDVSSDTGGRATVTTAQTSGGIQPEVNEVEAFIDILKKSLVTRQGDTLEPVPNLRRANMSNFINLLSMSQPAADLFYSMMTALQSLEQKGKAFKYPSDAVKPYGVKAKEFPTSAYQEILKQIRSSETLAENMRKVQELINAANAKLLVEKTGGIGDYNLVDLVQIFLPGRTVLENVNFEEDSILIGGTKVADLESMVLIPSLKCEVVFAAFDMPQKGEGFETLNSISNAVLDSFKANANITAEPVQAPIQPEDPPEESNIYQFPELPSPANQPFPEEERAMAAESRLYESILSDLMEAAAKKQRAAQRPKKIRLTKRQLQELLRRQLK